ncbi:MAG TPA: uroporphyrinogen decarboxylase family protein [Candidatus Latescibacteria bacterium]|jgi:hypothetical protein|nr:hypothetical protein [Gemmatimonadaceae bacterium]MDP6017861.1 uroporphyrinogen decarboxylase family protein [Candidatus Latescibacterota bacterium]HJP32517.1 uroporphyrinogen decarboxylase family protein [Candidatus Latescibacterota bacterium]
MTRRERLERCYRGQPVDRPAVYSRTGMPADDPTYDRLRRLLRERTELKAVWPSARLDAPYDIDVDLESHSADWDRRVSTLHTPAGDLTATYLVSRHRLPGLHETFFVDSAEAAETYLSLPLPDVGDDVSGFFAGDVEVGDAGIAEAGLGFNPAGFVAELCGSETFAVLSLTHRDLVHALCERQQRLLLQRLEVLLDRGVGPFFSILGQEYVVPPLHGPADFDDFNVRYDAPLIDRIHEAGGRIHVHCHGAVARVFDGFLAMGADVLHPIEPPPMGDITAAEARRRAGDRICLEGNLQIHELYESTPEEIRQQVGRLIDDAFTGAGLIVSASASPFIRGAGEDCYPQYEAMVDTVLARSAA